MIHDRSSAAFGVGISSDTAKPADLINVNVSRLILFFSIFSLCAAIVLMQAGCALHNPWDYNKPPTATGIRSIPAREGETRTVVVIGDFQNPTRSELRWREIGPGMSDIVARTLLNRGKFDVRINPELAKAVAEALNGPISKRRRKLDALKNKYQQVRYVVTGQVTDFHHTNEVPRELRRRWWLFGTRCEAIVAIALNVVDLETKRIVVADHIYGTSRASNASTKELYADIAFNSYLFWNSPLGRASEEAVDDTVDRLVKLVPQTDDELRIIRQINPRRVRLSKTPGRRFVDGDVMFVCIYDNADGQLRVVNDPATGDPLLARIDRDPGERVAAWLLGAKPDEIDLRGAVLVRDQPEAYSPGAGDERRVKGNSGNSVATGDSLRRGAVDNSGIRVTASSTGAGG